MKKIAFVLFTALVLSGCSENSTKTSAAAPVDTPKLSQDQLDSLARYNKYKSTMNVAFGKITFGITKKAFNKLNPDKPVTVGNSSYNIGASFTTKTNLLYQLDLTYGPKTANYIDNELNENMDNIISVITAKYGPPTNDSGKIQFFNFKPGYCQFVKTWDLFTKTIYIGMEEVYTGSEYGVVCRIVNNKMDKEEKEQSEQKTETKALSDTSKF